MQGSDIVAALMGILNTTSMKDLDTDYKIEIRKLLQLINLCLMLPSYQPHA